MAGHLFVTRGDLLNLACDAILIPSGTDGQGRRGHVLGHWMRAGIASQDGLVSMFPRPGERVRMCRPADGLSPAIWLGHTGDDDRSVDDDIAVIRRFVDRARRSEGVKVRPLDDDRPLLGVPLIATGAGGHAQKKGEVVKAVVKAAIDACKRADVDVVLVLKGESQYAAAQQARSRYQPPPPEVDEAMRGHIDRLAQHAIAGRLVLFMGAGTSMGAGLPSWGALLRTLMKQAKLTATERKALKGADYRDIGAILEDRMAGGLPDAIAAEMTVTRSSLIHQLLASLPVREALTTNYDGLFEQAWRDAGARPTILPAEGRAEGEWLLKLHGSIDPPTQIVLSRGDYLRLEGERGALAGLVQAMLLTRHLLFVGYSLTDDNFHRMVHQARDIVRSSARSDARLGTVLTPDPTNVLQELWRPEIDFHSTADDGTGGVRRLAIALDELAAKTAPVAAHLCDQTFEGVFREEELKVAQTMRELKRIAADDRVRDVLREAVEDALGRFGC